MRSRLLITVVAAAGFCLAGMISAAAQASPLESSVSLRPADSFAGIPDRQARSLALFGEIGKVLQHPRCLNCHPATERPRQGDQRRLHQPMVIRGKDGHGAPGLECASCHGRQNFHAARVPGDGHWALAPASMGWDGKTLGQICAQIKDRSRNGGRDLAAIVKHVRSDPLVLWAWRPGPGREPAPGTNAIFGALVEAWAGSGAACPDG